MKIGTNWRNPSIKFEFDKNVYGKLHTHHERLKYSNSTIEKFIKLNSNIPNLLKTSISQQTQTSIEQFTTVLCEYIDNIIGNVKYIHLVKFLAVASTFMKNLPRAEKYSNFADLICHFCFNQENKPYHHYFIATLHFLFQQSKFCESLIKNAQMNTIILSFLSGQYSEINAFCDSILTDELVSSLIMKENPSERTEMCAENSVPRLFQFVIDQRAQISSIFGIIQFLSKLTFKICQKYHIEIQRIQNQQPSDEIDNTRLLTDLKAQNQTLVDRILQKEVIGGINVCLKMKEDSSVIIQTYRHLLKCTSFNDSAGNSGFLVINPRVLQRLFQLYKESAVSTKKSVLSYFLSEDDLYKHPFCCYCCTMDKREHFPLEKFCLIDVVEDRECFEMYSKIIEKVIHLKFPEVVERPFQKILLLIKPSSSKPSLDKISHVFKWFMKILPIEGVSTKFFRDQSFFSDFITNPPNEVAIEYIKNPDFFNVLSMLIDEKRNPHRKHSLIKKMIDLAFYQPEIQKSLLSLISEHFGPDIFRFYLKNIDDPKIHDVFDPFLPFNTYDFRSLFMLGNSFQIVLRKINSPQFLVELLKLICLIVIPTNDHFFDEWVIMQPKDSPIFKLNSEVIRDYVIPGHNEIAIYVPSLLPLIKDYFYEGDSSFNMYLIGRFASPIYKKLGLENPYFPLLYSYYIYSIDQIKPSYMNDNKKLIKKSDFIVPSYEFFPHSPSGYLKVSDIPVSSISFSIKFNKITADSVCFMKFSGLSLIFKSGNIWIANEAPIKINIENWTKISVKSKLFSRTEISINNTIITVSKAFQFECLGDNNGITFIPYMIDRNIVINEMENSAALVTLHGSASFVPIHSISDFFENYQNFLKVINIYADSDETRNINFLISLAKFIKPNKLISFYSDIFQAILRNNSKIQNNDWIHFLVDSINSIENIQIRTNVFINFLFDIEIWNKLPIDLIKNFISYFLSKLNENPLQNDLIFTKYNFLFSIIISHHFDSSKKSLQKKENASNNPDELNNQTESKSENTLRKLFFSLWKIVSKNLTNTDVIITIVPFAFTVKISSLCFSLNMQEFDVMKVLDGIELVNDERTEIVDFIYELEKTYKIEFFNHDQLLELSLTQSEEIAEKSFDALKDRLNFNDSSDVQFMSSHKTAFAIVGQRFCTKESTWIYFIKFFCRQKFEKIPTNVESVTATQFAHPELLLIFIRMLVTLSKTILSIENEQSEYLIDLIELRKNAFEFIYSVVLSSKIDYGYIFDKQFLFSVSDLITGGEIFNVNNWLVKNKNDLNSLFDESKYSSDFTQKYYQSIPLFAPLFTKIYDESMQKPNIDSNSDNFIKMAIPFYQALITVSIRNEEYFLRILQFLLGLSNNLFIEENLMHILGFVANSNMNYAMYDYLRKFFYILSIRKPSIYTPEFINHVFSKCVNGHFFYVLSTFIMYNEDFSFLPQNENKFEPFLTIIEKFGSLFFKGNLRGACYLAVKLIKEGCIDQVFNDFLNLFASVKSSKSLDNLSSENSEITEEQESEIKEAKKLGITKEFIQSYVGPTFTNLLCSLHDAEKITADKQVFEQALAEFDSLYNEDKKQLETEILKLFEVSDQGEKSATSENDNNASDNANSVQIRNDQATFAQYVIKMISRSLKYCFEFNSFFFDQFNLKLRKKEFNISIKYFKLSMLHSQQMKTDCEEKAYTNQYVYRNDRNQFDHKVITRRIGKSYKVSPFISPFSIPTAIFPSSFSLKTPNEPVPECKEIDKTLVFLKPTVEFSVPSTDEYPSYIFEFSSLYNYPPGRVLPHFESIYGKVDSMMNCILIRLDLRVDSVIMKLGPKTFIVLTDSTIETKTEKPLSDQNEIKLNKKITPDLSADFLNGDYGRFSMFCGHFVLIIFTDDILLSTPYISLNNENAVYVNSLTAGSFIIEFLPENKTGETGGGMGIISNMLAAISSPILGFPCPFSSMANSSKGRKYLMSVNESKSSWLANEMSNMEYLLRLNRAAQRSFCDLSSYPIIPRILKDFSQDEFPFVFENAKHSHLHQKHQTKQNEKQLFSSSVPSLPSYLESEKKEQAQAQSEPQNKENTSFIKSVSSPTIQKETSQSEHEDNRKLSSSLEDSTSFASETNNKESVPSILRDLSLPIQIASNIDTDLEVYRRRCNSQSYFYAENISNPLSVSGILIRLSPFCRALWFLNDGWDKGSRNFISIQNFFRITQKTIYEFPPEAFIGSTFINWNKFILPNGEELVIRQYPQWKILHSSHGVSNKEITNLGKHEDKKITSISSTGNIEQLEMIDYNMEVPFKFAELQRFMLEMNETRAKLNEWIDLYFGNKQNSLESYNIFAPMSYITPNMSEPQRGWMQQCGRVPLKIFDSKHESYKTNHNDENDSSLENRKLSDGQEKEKETASNQFPPSEESIKYYSEFDVNDIEFHHSNIDNQYSKQENHKLCKGYSMIINPIGITILKTKSTFLLSTSKTEINNFDTSFIDSTCFDDFYLTKDKEFFAISYIDNTVVAGRIIYESENVPSILRPLCQINVGNASEQMKEMSGYQKRTVINSSHLICATSFINKVIVWSISNGHVLWEASFFNDKKGSNEIFSTEEEENAKDSEVRKVDIKTNQNLNDGDDDENDEESYNMKFERNKNNSTRNEDNFEYSIGALEFDEVSDTLFVGAGNSLFQMSLSGVVVREIVLNDRITAISSFGFGFTIAERVVAVGLGDGSVQIISVCLKNNRDGKIENSFDASDKCEIYGEFEVVKDIKLCNTPIYSIESKDFSYDISVVDLSFKYPQFLKQKNE